MKYVATLNGQRYEVELERIDDFQPLSRQQVDQGVPEALPTAVPPAPAPVQAAPTVPSPAPAPAAPQAAPVSASGQTVASPMPGTILRVDVAPGASVTRGQVLLVMEAMKMENDIVAPADAVVADVHVNKGDAVDTGAILVTLQ